MAKTQYVKSLAHKAMAGTAVHTYHKTCVQSYVTHTIGHKFTVSQMRIETLLIACREICLLLLVDSCSSQRSDSTRYKWNHTDTAVFSGEIWQDSMRASESVASKHLPSAYILDRCHLLHWNHWTIVNKHLLFILHCSSVCVGQIRRIQHVYTTYVEGGTS